MPDSKQFRVVAPADWPEDASPFGIDFRTGGEAVRVEADEIVKIGAADGSAHAVGMCGLNCGLSDDSDCGWLVAQGFVEEVR